MSETAINKSEAYKSIQEGFKIVYKFPGSFRSLNIGFVRAFETKVKEVEAFLSKLDEKDEDSRNKAISGLFAKYVGSKKFKNCVDVWNEWQKIEDKFNAKGIELVYGPVPVMRKFPPATGQKSEAYRKFEYLFKSGKIGENPSVYKSMAYAHITPADNSIDRVEANIGTIKEKIAEVKEGKNPEASTELEKAKQAALASMTSFYEEIVRGVNYRNCIDVWIEFMKLENKFNEVGIELEYAKPSITGSSPPESA